ncbi:MAG: hypothetical protein K6F39_03395 [Lachnospiraceae bacterium]|nr:hypothetical protein [Lachnospiraceae bacterium]
MKTMEKRDSRGVDSGYVVFTAVEDRADLPEMMAQAGIENIRSIDIKICKCGLYGHAGLY